MLSIDWYKPAFKGGGTITSVESLTGQTSDSVDYHIFTGDRDFKDTSPFKGITFNTWVRLKDEVVYYAAGSVAWRFYKQLKAIKPDLLNIVGLYSPIYSIFPIIVSRFFLKKQRYLVSPHGMLQEGALNVKNKKKSLYLKLARQFNLYKNCSFHATDAQEKLDIIEHLKINESKVTVVSNLPQQLDDFQRATPKNVGELRIVYFSRITPKKNLHFLPPVLKEIESGSIVLDIIGPIDIDEYWLNIQSELSALPNVETHYHGALRQHQAFELMTKSHFMILPTTGENYGYVIVESFSLGLPVIISDKTPWHNLKESGIGYDIPLEDKQAWVDALKEMVDMDDIRYQPMRARSLEFVQHLVNVEELKKEYLAMFEEVATEQDILIVSPFPKKRYKGGITVFTENILNHKNVLSERNIHLSHLNTCVIPRSNRITGKLHWKNELNSLLFIWTGIVAVVRGKYSHIHHHTSVGLSLIKDTISAVTFGYFGRCKVILHIHSAQTVNMFTKPWMRRTFLRLSKNRISKIIVLGDEVKDFLISNGIEDDKIDVLPNFYTSYKKEIEVIANKKQTIQLAYIGSIEKMKGIKDLLDALELITDCDWQIEIAGEFIDPKFEEEVRSNSFFIENKDRIHFLGYVDYAEKNTFYSKADILILPSYSEGMPISILEGMFYRTAIITTNVGANQQYFGTVSNLLNPGDIHGLAKEIETFIEDPELLEMRKNQAKSLSADYDFDRFKEKLIHIFNNT